MRSEKLILISGPCVVESKDILEEIAGVLDELCRSLNITLIFKASYRKANRSRKDSFTGLGDEKALQILKGVAEGFNLPVTTDVHATAECAMAAEVAEVLQIPAFLCRQTDLLEAAALTGKTVNIKKGQFMSPEAMVYAVDKVKAEGNTQVWLTERGTTFGYQDLVVDFRGIPVMRRFAEKVILDCTHSLQQPNQAGGVTGGRPELITTMALAGVASGADGLFIETHPRPEKALSDGANMLPLNRMEELLNKVLRVFEALDESV